MILSALFLKESPVIWDILNKQSLKNTNKQAIQKDQFPIVVCMKPRLELFRVVARIISISRIKVHGPPRFVEIKI